MVWMLWFVSWVFQLYFLQSTLWFGVAWPLFVAYTLVMAKYVDLKTLSWWLIVLGVLADVSSHLPKGVVFRSYVVLLLGVWIVMFAHNNWIKVRRVAVEIAVVAIILFLQFVSQSTSLATFFAMLDLCLLIWILMAIITMYCLDWFLIKSNIVKENDDEVAT